MKYAIRQIKDGIQVTRDIQPGDHVIDVPANVAGDHVALMDYVRQALSIEVRDAVERVENNATKSVAPGAMAIIIRPAFNYLPGYVFDRAFSDAQHAKRHGGTPSSRELYMFHSLPIDVE